MIQAIPKFEEEFYEETRRVYLYGPTKVARELLEPLLKPWWVALFLFIIFATDGLMKQIVKNCV